jgi:hypothetical protein
LWGLRVWGFPGGVPVWCFAGLGGVFWGLRGVRFAGGLWVWPGCPGGGPGRWGVCGLCVFCGLGVVWLCCVVVWWFRVDAIVLSWF